MAPISPSTSSNPHLLALRSFLPSTPVLQSRSPLPATSPTSTTRSLQPLSKTLSSIFRRQTVVAIPATYADLNSGPSPGTVVGIVLGSVGGFLLLLWLIYTCFNMAGGRSGSVITEEEIVRRRSRSPRRRSRSSAGRTEISEISRPRSVAREPPRREARRETIIIEETRRAPEREREDDIVEVIEDHSPPRRSRRGSQRQSGYRTVDPGVYGGGSAPVRKVSGRR